MQYLQFDAGAAGVADSAVITIPKPTDVSGVLYRIQDHVSNSTPADTGWVALPSSTTIPWTFDADIEAKTITYQFKDIYGNITSVVTTATIEPILASSFLIQDASNSSIPSYDMYIGWKSVDDPAFSSYKLEFATSTDNSVYGAYSPVGSGLSNPVTNYYVHRNLDSSKYYRYRLGVVSTNGNTSIRAGAFTTAKPDGVQNFGEGGSGGAATAAQIQNIVPTQGVDKNVSITYLFTDSSAANKTTPSYDARVFYNTGITLPSNAFAGGNLTVSDASKMPTSGFVQINNEVIGYTGKTGNTLTGLTRGTWPTGGRGTRQNLIFFAFVQERHIISAAIVPLVGRTGFSVKCNDLGCPPTALLCAGVRHTELGIICSLKDSRSFTRASAKRLSSFITPVPLHFNSFSVKYFIAVVTILLIFVFFLQGFLHKSTETTSHQCRYYCCQAHIVGICLCTLPEQSNKHYAKHGYQRNYKHKEHHSH